MKLLKTGSILWDTIEEAARQKHKVGEEFTLTMVDLGHPFDRNVGECEYRINHKETKQFYRGFVVFDPYL